MDRQDVKPQPYYQDESVTLYHGKRLDQGVLDFGEEPA